MATICQVHNVKDRVFYLSTADLSAVQTQTN